MNYSNLAQGVKNFYIIEYSNASKELRAKASNPRTRKAAEFTQQADALDAIVVELRA